MPQLPALLPGTVADNVAFASGLAGRRSRTSARCSGSAGLDAAYADRDVAELSVGEQQRAMLARALALEPRVLLLDEPTSALDEEARDAVEATISRLARELGVSIVLVTHDRGQARRLARVVRIEAGRAAARREAGCGVSDAIDISLGRSPRRSCWSRSRSRSRAGAAPTSSATSGSRSCARSSSSPRSAT